MLADRCTGQWHLSELSAMVLGPAPEPVLAGWWEQSALLARPVQDSTQQAHWYPRHRRRRNQSMRSTREQR